MSFNPVVYFVSTEYIKENTPIEKSVEDQLIIPMITQAEQLYLQQSIGETGLNALKNAIVNNTLTADEDTFIRNFVQPLVSNYTYYLVLPHITYKSTNKSLSKESSEYSTPVDLEELKYLRNSVKDVCEFYQRRMVKWLLDHPGVFSWYDSPDSKDNLRKTTQSYFSGMYTPRTTGLKKYPIYTEPYGSTNPCNDIFY
jgi:hypothetical protein